MKMNIIKKVFIISFVISIMMVGFAFADENDDLHTGPGVGLLESSYNFEGKEGYVYNADGLSNGIEGNYVSEAGVEEGVGPTYKDIRVDTPIDSHNAVDMGPTSGYVWSEYSLHSINDGGPGMNVITNELGNTSYYVSGPGAGIMNKEYNENSPIVKESDANPENYAFIIANGGPTSGEVAISFKKKNQ